MSASSLPIVLVGMMLSGKTTVGNCLARRLGWPFFDLDLEIERQAGSSISEIFYSKGEAYFRQQEREMLHHLLSADEPRVIALGGGAFQDPLSRARCLDQAWVVYLVARLQTLVKRIENAPDARPLLQTPTTSQETLKRLLDERQEAYLEAQVSLAVEGRSPEELAAQISLLYRSFGEKPRS